MKWAKTDVTRGSYRGEMGGSGLFRRVHGNHLRTHKITLDQNIRPIQDFSHCTRGMAPDHGHGCPCLTTRCEPLYLEMHIQVKLEMFENAKEFLPIGPERNGLLRFVQLSKDRARRDASL